MHGQAALRRFEFGNDASRFQTDAAVAVKAEGFLLHMISFVESRFHIPRRDLGLESQVVVHIVMQDRCIRGQGLVRVGHRRQFVPCHGDELGPIFGLGPAIAQDGGNRLALPADHVAGQGELLRRCHCREQFMFRPPG